MIPVSSNSCICPIQVLSREWRCSWSSADRRCSNYIWVIHNRFAFSGAAYIGGFDGILRGASRGVIEYWVSLYYHGLTWSRDGWVITCSVNCANEITCPLPNSTTSSLMFMNARVISNQIWYCKYLSMMGLKLIHFCTSGPWRSTSSW